MIIKEGAVEEVQIEGVLTLISRFIYVSDEMKEPLECLGSIIRSNYVNTAVYDIMDNVVTNMV